MRTPAPRNPRMNSADSVQRSTGLLTVDGLSYAYTDAVRGAQTAALKNISFSVARGEFVSILGPSGCGKSTLLAAVSGLLSDFDGTISIKDDVITSPHPDVGVVFQEDTTFPWRTVRKNVEFGLEVRGVSKGDRSDKAHEILSLFGLNGFEDSYPNQLSGGMRQRVAIARTMVLEPDLLLMDEPFGALDEQTRLVMGDELLRVQQSLQQTVLFITHNIQESVMLSDRVIVLGSRPGCVKDMIDVDLARPRDSSLIARPEFATVVGRIWSVLKDEAMHGFDQR